MAEKRAPLTAPELLLKIVLAGTQSHYEVRGLIDDKRLEHLLHAGKQILYKSHQESDVRQNLGFSASVWQGLTNALRSAIPVLEQQSFAWKNTTAQSFNGSSSDLIAANYFILVKDIERLNDLCTIARNLLATTRRAQNLAAEKGFDQQILKLIDVCVRVTARGFDGETNVRNEERWQKVVNLYKRLLITCLQFLHNFIMHNEHRKLVLWLDLFGSTSPAAQQAQQTEIQSVQDQINLEKKLNIQAEPGGEIEQLEKIDSPPKSDSNGKADLQTDKSAASQLSDLGYNLQDVQSLFDYMTGDKRHDIAAQEASRVLMDQIKRDMERLSGLSADQLDEDAEALLKTGAALRAQLPANDLPTSDSTSRMMITVPRSILGTDMPGNLNSNEQEITKDDLIMSRTSQSAAETLQEAKDELMARLQDHALISDEDGEQLYEEDPAIAEVLEDGLLDSAEDSLEDEEEDEDEDDYRSPGDQERGLLTDVPLVLGPTEIEALPMIIQAGIVDNFGVKNPSERQGVRNMQAVRCHILLAQEAGRNVLRELLIFIAAWDLPDDEFYFKMMVQIMEAILKNGLMSHAYSDFGQAKDIISPAQAVVIKILTHIFRAKYSPSSTGQNGNDNLPAKPKMPAPLSRVDVLTVRYIFTVFRGNIIPETCALIYLQGQIRSGLAMSEDFPLNLWDMERVYEGVYQFLEFFAVLTENNDWKRLLIDWEIVYDLVTLIKELDTSIPKATLTASIPAQDKSDKSEKQIPQPPLPPTNGISPNSSMPPPPPPAVSVERPYERPSTPEHPANAAHSTLPPPPPSAPAAPSKSPSTSPPPATTASTEDPSLFEWRNLKKLIVLVLSSLVWKSATVQDQIRLYSGVETILSCTQYDGHNPYIKEHAVMCLKFLLEGNKENQQIVRDLEARGVVNQDDLQDQFGVNAQIREGKVQVRRAQVQHRNPAEVSSKAVRRASDGNMNTSAAAVGAGASSTAERIANMTERFNQLDISSFARGLPISQTQTQQGSTGQEASTSRIQELDDDDGDIDGVGEAEQQQNRRVQDVGDML